MINNFLRYYSEPTITHAEILWESLLSLDLSTVNLEEVAEAKRKLPELPAEIYLKSSGSCGSPCRYPFGPNFDFWWRKIEWHTKFRNNTTVRLAPSLFTDVRESCVKRYVRTDQPCDYQFLFGLHFPEGIEFLIEELNKLNDTCTLWLEPNDLLYLLSDDKFVAFLHTGKITCLLTTGSDAFYKWSRVPINVRINDNMVNWVNLSNFYTCQYRRRHVLPIFHNETNLINLCHTSLPSGDQFLWGSEIKQCECGRDYVDVRFVPHIDMAVKGGGLNRGVICYDLDLIERLDSSYRNIQFIQSDDRVDILFIGEMSEHDHSHLRDWFEQQGLLARFLRNMYLPVGRDRRKLPVFFNNKNCLHYSSITGIHL